MFLRLFAGRASGHWDLCFSRAFPLFAGAGPDHVFFFRTWPSPGRWGASRGTRRHKRCASLVPRKFPAPRGLGPSEASWVAALPDARCSRDTAFVFNSKYLQSTFFQSLWRGRRVVVSGVSENVWFGCAGAFATVNLRLLVFLGGTVRTPILVPHHGLQNCEYLVGTPRAPRLVPHPGPQTPSASG